MSNIDKRAYYEKFAHVSVNDTVWSHTSKCCKCKTNNQEFSVFLGEGQRLSTMFSTVCSQCLPETIKEALEQGRKDAEEQIKRAEQRQYEEAIKLVRKNKLNELEETK